MIGMSKFGRPAFRAMHLVFCVVFAMGGNAIAEEEQAPPKEGVPPPKEGAPPPKEGQAAPGEQDRGRGRGPDGGAHRGRGRGGFADMAGRPGGGFGGFNPQRMLEQGLDREFGKDPAPDLDELPYGAERRWVTRVPVGGVDNLNERERPWPVEDVFTVSEEQKAALKKLREDYKADLEPFKKLMEAFNLALAEQVEGVRQKYEAKANALLSDEARAGKEKLDALAVQYKVEKEKSTGAFGKNADEIKDAANKVLKAGDEDRRTAARDIFERFMTLRTQINEIQDKLAKQYQDQMKQTLTGEAREKFTALLEKLQKDAERRAAWMRHGRDGGDGGEQDRPKSVPPPKPDKDEF